MATIFVCIARCPFVIFSNHRLDGRHLARLRGFRFDSSPAHKVTPTVKGGTDLLRRKFPASGFDGTHPPLNTLSLTTPLTHVTTSLNNTGFALLSRLLDTCPEHRITAEDAKRDRWFTSRPPPDALGVTDIMPLLQLAKIQDIASDHVPQFAPTWFSNQSQPPLVALAQAVGNAAAVTSLVHEQDGGGGALHRGGMCYQGRPLNLPGDSYSRPLVCGESWCWTAWGPGPAARPETRLVGRRI